MEGADHPNGDRPDSIELELQADEAAAADARSKDSKNAGYPPTTDPLDSAAPITDVSGAGTNDATASGDRSNATLNTSALCEHDQSPATAPIETQPRAMEAPAVEIDLSATGLRKAESLIDSCDDWVFMFNPKEALEVTMKATAALLFQLMNGSSRTRSTFVPSTALSVGSTPTSSGWLMRCDETLQRASTLHPSDWRWRQSCGGVPRCSLLQKGCEKDSVGQEKTAGFWPPTFPLQDNSKICVWSQLRRFDRQVCRSGRARLPMHHVRRVRQEA
eukprot:m.360201 g.360201  ORF g.360201 m.360201 type:complete len:275 (-) comp16637_c0_seq3:2796-3620(-)